jgi:hypothetical protein
MMGSCEHGNEPSGAIQGSLFHHCMSDYSILERNSASYLHEMKLKEVT